MSLCSYLSSAVFYVCLYLISPLLFSLSFSFFFPLSPCLSLSLSLSLSLPLSFNLFSTCFLPVYPLNSRMPHAHPDYLHYPLFTWKVVHVSIMSNAVTNLFAVKLRNKINWICISLKANMYKIWISFKIKVECTCPHISTSSFFKLCFFHTKSQFKPNILTRKGVSNDYHTIINQHVYIRAYAWKSYYRT